MKNLLKRLNPYRKFVVAIALGVVAVLDSIYGPGNELSRLVIALATASGVYAVPNG